MKATTLIYLHGLNSSSRSHKASVLRERLAPFPVEAIDYPAHRPSEAIACLSAALAARASAADWAPPVVIGSSMGGFYGQYLARRFSVSHLFMINPALTPWTFLTDVLGETLCTADGERYPVTADLIASLRHYGIDDPCDGIPTTLFLDRGDEVIDPRIAERLYGRCGRLLIWEGGDHAFQHLDAAIEVIRAHLEGRADSATTP